MDEREQLLSAIAADPDAVENWIVYADWLTDRGDPRGELIALELAIEAKVANEEAVERHRALLRDETAWLSPRLEAESHHLGLQLWRSFIRRAHVFGPPDDLPTHETLAALFADPHACVLHTFDAGPHTDLLEGSRSDAVRELLVQPRNSTELPLADCFPMLEMLELSSRGIDDVLDDRTNSVLEVLAHPRLRLIHGTAPALASGDFDLPNLDTLHIDGDPLGLFEARGILQAPPPRLVNLQFDTEQPAFVAALRASPLCAQLRSLSVRFVRPIVDELARDPGSFSHVALKGWGWADTNEERDALQARFSAVFPNAAVLFGSGEDLGEVEEERPPSIEPVALQGIGDAVMRLVDKMKARLPKP